MDLRYDDSGARRKLDPANIGRLFEALKAELHAWAIEDEGAFRAKRLNGRPGLHRWTGGLARSFVPIWEAATNATRAGFMFLPKITTPAGVVDSYAGIHETGGIIRPKNGKLLAWPVKGGPAMTAGGRNRFGDSPRNYPGKLFFFRSKAGHMFLAESQNVKGGRKLGPMPPRLVYNLATHVEIPARLEFRNFALPSLRRGFRRLQEAQAAFFAGLGGGA